MDVKLHKSYHVQNDWTLLTNLVIVTKKGKDFLRTDTSKSRVTFIRGPNSNNKNVFQEEKKQTSKTSKQSQT